jgi:hypothetical protein
MYLSVGVVLVLVLVFASPIIWVAWWLLADLGQRANSSHARPHTVTAAQSRRQVA